MLLRMYLVQYEYGDYDDYGVTPIFVTEKLFEAQDYVEKFNRIAEKMKERSVKWHKQQAIEQEKWRAAGHPPKWKAFRRPYLDNYVYWLGVKAFLTEIETR